MDTRLIEAVQDKNRPGNWGKFLVGIPSAADWQYVSTVSGGPLLRDCGWRQPRIWVLDYQTGEGAFYNPGGSAHADLEKHRIWVCPLYEPFLEWLYAWHRGHHGIRLAGLPALVELPGAEFAFSGHRRPGVT